MKRNKKNNVIVQQPQDEGNKLVMTDSNGKLVQASNIHLSKDFASIAEKITNAKGGKLDEKTKELLEMTEIWTPDMVGPVAEEKPKAAVAAEEKPKAKRKRKPKAEKTVEEKPKKKATRKKKEDTNIEEKPKRTKKNS